MLIVQSQAGRSEFRVRPLKERTARKVKRVAVDTRGRHCRRALLTHDGLLLGAGATAQGYENVAGDTLKRGEVLAVDADGNPLRHLPSTRNCPQRVLGPVSPEEILAHVVEKSHILTPITLVPDLREALEAGEIFRVAWRPRASVTDKPAFLLANKQGFFMIQCQAHRAEFIQREEAVSVEEYEDEEEDWDAWDDVETEAVANGAEHGS